MTDEEVEAVFRRGTTAQSILDNEQLMARFDELKLALIRQWEATAPGSVSLREQIWFQVNGLNAVLGSLQVDIENAKVTAAQIERRQQKRK